MGQSKNSLRLTLEDGFEDAEAELEVDYIERSGDTPWVWLKFNVEDDLWFRLTIDEANELADILDEVLGR